MQEERARRTAVMGREKSPPTWRRPPTDPMMRQQSRTEEKAALPTTYDSCFSASARDVRLLGDVPSLLNLSVQELAFMLQDVP